LIRSIDDQDNIQQLLSPLKRLKTTTPMEASNDNNEAKAEPVKTISKSGYLVKVMDKKKRIRYSFYRTTLFILGLRYN
jgi:hypothetical protein